MQFFSQKNCQTKSHLFREYFEMKISLEYSLDKICFGVESVLFICVCVK